MTATPPARRPRRRLFSGGVLDIQSKLLVMLLLVSIAATIVVGVIGYVSGRSSLQEAATDQVTALRETRTRAIEKEFSDIQQAVVLDSRNASAVGAVRALTAGFAELAAQPVDPAQKAAVDAYYSDTFVPEFEARTGDEADPRSFQPDSAAEVYLQANYTITSDDFDAKLQVDDAGDGSAWSAARAEYHDYFRELVNQLGYEDVLVLDTDGNVVYTAYSGVDLGTNVIDGPYAGSALATVYGQALGATTIDASFLTDFSRYAPSLNVPTAWAASPIGSDGQNLGVMAVQIPIDRINAVMTGDEQWATDGLGSTGEAYLAGPDETMRSVSRQLIEDPEQFESDVVAAGTSPAIAARQVAINGNVLLQPVRTTAVERALRGDTDTIVTTDYLGHEVIAAFAPLEIEGLQWVIVAKVDASEAFAPVDAFTRTLLLSIAGIVVAVSLLSLLLAQVFVRPIRRLQEVVHRVSAGELGAEIDAKPGDEFGDLGTSFNEMSRSLRLKQDLIDEQRAENERLLLTLMPESVAKRYRQGEETIAEDHQDVSVAFTDVAGFAEYSRGMASSESLGVLNGIWRSFDDAAEAAGVERVRSSRSGYLVSCGLTVPRVDNAQRIVDFAREAQAIVDRFNVQNGSTLELRAGLDTGTVTSGLVGRTSVVYDLWGDAVSLAFSLQGAAKAAGIYATQRVVDRLGDGLPMSDAGTVETTSGPQRVWKLDRVDAGV